jgi:hypothetical protein
MAKKNKKGQCVYCGQTTILTHDHVPPQNLFPKPRPKLITVPSCASCNKNASKDDEHFRLWLVMRDSSKGNPARDDLFPLVWRSLLRPEAPGLATTFIKEPHRVVERFTPAGLYLGRAIPIEFEGTRLDSVARRITAGLFFHEKGHRLPDDHCVLPLSLYRLKDMEPYARETCEDFVGALLRGDPHEFGAAFRYWWAQSPNGVDNSLWLFEFYGRLEYFCTTAPIDLSQQPWIVRASDLNVIPTQK